MARECSICSKGRRSGNNVSHANNRTKRVFQPNLQRVRVIINSAPKYIMACTRCLRSNRVQKAV
ncbi:MAG: 50S ribosomal protein L28 [Nitrospirae bacterium]|nr:50S ribosomal protein L28 [Nitrospirota bacterium]